MATSNNEWLHIYNNNLRSPQPNVLRWSDDVVTEATTITTTTTTSTMASSSVSNQLGRVARPTNMRRRSRVSRRTPTTLLNTDTTNFRAMVQQFTGGGGGGGSTFITAPAAVAPRQTLSSWNTNSAGLDYYGTGSRISPVGGDGYNTEFRQPQDQQYYTMVADNGGGGGGDHQHGFVQRVQEGGTFSSDNYNYNNNNNNIGKNTTNMF